MTWKCPNTRRGLSADDNASGGRANQSVREGTDLLGRARPCRFIGATRCEDMATREIDATMAAIGTATVGCPRLDGAEPVTTYPTDDLEGELPDA